MLQDPERFLIPAINFFKSAVIAIAAAAILFAFPAHGTLEVQITGDNLLQIINRDRSQHNLSPLRRNEKLEMAAQAKANDILKKGYFSHTAPDGTIPWTFIDQTGFRYKIAGENLAINYQDPYELHRDLLASDSHRQNLLSPDFSDAGIAVARGFYQGKPSVIIVQFFAAPSDTLVLND